MPQGNLKPQSTRTKSEQREIAHMGGKASVAARRHKRDLREHMLLLLEGEEDGVTGMERLTIAMFRKALTGDVKAYEAVLAAAGKSPRQTLELSSPLPGVKSVSDMPKLTTWLLERVADGSLTMEDATKLASLADAHRKTLEVADLENRISKLEERQV